MFNNILQKKLKTYNDGDNSNQESIYQGRQGQLAAGAGGAGKGAGKGAGARIRGIGGEGAEGAESGWTRAVASGDEEDETWTYI